MEEIWLSQDVYHNWLVNNRVEVIGIDRKRMLTLVRMTENGKEYFVTFSMDIGKFKLTEV